MSPTRPDPEPEISLSRNETSRLSPCRRSYSLHLLHQRKRGPGHSTHMHHASHLPPPPQEAETCLQRSQCLCTLAFHHQHPSLPSPSPESQCDRRFVGRERVGRQEAMQRTSRASGRQDDSYMSGHRRRNINRGKVHRMIPPALSPHPFLSRCLWALLSSPAVVLP